MKVRTVVPVLCAASTTALASLSLGAAGCRTDRIAAAPTKSQQSTPISEVSDTDALVLPTPPRQNAPWAPPSGSAANGLPLPLITAAKALFDQGLADPRGGEYRTLTVHVGDVWRGDGGIVETRGWVLPGKTDGKTFAVGWNGLVYPVVAVKGKADLRADIERMVKTQEQQLAKRPSSIGFTLSGNRATPEATSLSADGFSLLKAVYLLRLGENDLARRVVALFETGMPPRTNGNDDIRRDPYLHLASQWAWSAYDRAVTAHMRGADALALADCDLLVRAAPQIEAEAASRGYTTYPSGGIHREGDPFLPFLANLPELRKDAARRVAEPARPALDLKALSALPPKERIARLIERLDEIDARQDGQPGGVGLDAHPIPQALIAEGEASIDPLLDVLEKDERLTRSVSFPRDFFQSRNLLTVRSAAFACFARITDVTQIGAGNGGKPSVAELRAWWEKNRNVSPSDRWFTQLADDGESLAAPPADASSRSDNDQRRRQEFDRIRVNKSRWEEAARRIVERTNIRQVGNWVTAPTYTLGQPLPPFKGEPLRGRRDPSVSDLLRKRALQMSEPTEGRWGFDFASGASFALMLYEWDPKSPLTLPTLQEVMLRCRDFQNRQTGGSGSTDQYQLSGRIARLTLARMRLGDEAAAREYGEWLREVSPEYLGFETQSALLPLTQEPDDPAVRRIAVTLFREESGTPGGWSRLLADPASRDNYAAQRLFASELLRLPSFRDLVIRRLRDTTEAGVVVQPGKDDRMRSFTWKDGSREGPTPPSNAGGARQTLRVCDRAAQALQTVSGVPRFDPLAPVSGRDRQCTAIAAYLTRYGPTLGRARRERAEPLYSYAMGDRFGYLGPTFPPLDRPATEADIRENRAIFSLGDVTSRVVADLPAPLPLEAGWDRDPNANQALRSDGKRVPWSRGYIWQAEEAFENGKWVRYYGYVGPHSVTRVPASAIQITDFRARQPGTAQR